MNISHVSQNVNHAGKDIFNEIITIYGNGELLVHLLFFNT